MSIKTLNKKEEVLQYFIDKAGATKLELEQFWVEFEKEAKEWELEGDDALLHIKTRLNSTFKKRMSSQAKEHTDIFVYGKSTTDYGAKGKWNKAIEMFKNNPEQAINDGFVNAEGIPLNKGRMFKADETIDLKNATSTIIYGIEKIGEENKKVEISLKGEYKLDLFKTYDTRLILKGTKDSGIIKYSGDTTTRLIEKKAFADTDVIQIIKENFANNIVTFQNFAEKHNAQQSDFDRLFVIKGNVTDISIISKEGANNRVEIDELSDSWEEGMIKTISCWYDKTLPLPPVGTQNAIVFGRSSINKEGVPSMNAYGIFIPEKFRNKIKPQTVSDDERIEKEVNEIWA